MALINYGKFLLNHFLVFYLALSLPLYHFQMAYGSNSGDGEDAEPQVLRMAKRDFFSIIHYLREYNGQVSAENLQAFHRIVGLSLKKLTHHMIALEEEEEIAEELLLPFLVKASKLHEVLSSLNQLVVENKSIFSINNLLKSYLRTQVVAYSFWDSLSEWFSTYWVTVVSLMGVFVVILAYLFTSPGEGPGASFPKGKEDMKELFDRYYNQFKLGIIQPYQLAKSRAIKNLEPFNKSLKKVKIEWFFFEHNDREKYFADFLKFFNVDEEGKILPRPSKAFTTFDLSPQFLTIRLTPVNGGTFHEIEKKTVTTISKILQNDFKIYHFPRSCGPYGGKLCIGLRWKLFEKKFKEVADSIDELKGRIRPID